MNTGTQHHPHLPTHPGLVLKEVLAKRGVKQNELAEEVGVLPSQLNEVLKGKRSISPELAILLGAVLEKPNASYWNTLQANFNLDSANIQDSILAKKEAIEQWRGLKELLPIKFFRKENLLSGNLQSDITRILNILDFPSIKHLERKLIDPESAGTLFKKSGKIEAFIPHVNTWVRYVRHLSTEQKAPAFSLDSRDEVIASMKKVFAGNNVKEKLPQTLKKYGIKLVIKEKPDMAPIDGASFWHEDNPVIALTLRHSRFDNLVFTVYHELGHVFMHLKPGTTDSFVDSLDDSKGKNPREEEEANAFAGNCIVPEELWDEFTRGQYNFTDSAISHLAARVGTPAPSIWGRLCFEGKIKYSAFSRFKSCNQIP